MRLLKPKTVAALRRSLSREGAGEATLLPEEPEDMWHTFNLLQKGDRLRAAAIRCALEQKKERRWGREGEGEANQREPLSSGLAPVYTHMCACVCVCCYICVCVCMCMCASRRRTALRIGLKITARPRSFLAPALFVAFSAGLLLSPPHTSCHAVADSAPASSIRLAKAATLKQHKARGRDTRHVRQTRDITPAAAAFLRHRWALPCTPSAVYAAARRCPHLPSALDASRNRKVQQETSTGSVSSQRVRMVLCIQVLAVDFDTEGCSLRVKGKNVEENPYVKVRLAPRP